MSPETGAQPSFRNWIWALAAFGAIAVMAICASAAFIVHRTSSAAVSILRGDVSSSFTSYTLGISGKAQLVLCSAKRVELLKMSVPNRVSYSEISIIIPVEYNYYVDMKGSWSLVADEGVLKVVAPQLEILTPSPDLPGTMVVIDKSIFDFGRAQEKLSDLKAQATSRLKIRGMSPEALKEVRETARMELASFLGSWLTSANKGNAERILVRFADEPQFPSIGYANNPKR